MIRLTSIQQALSLRSTIPELAVIRSIQFMGVGYIPEEHGHIIVVQEGDDITQTEEIGDDGLLTDDIPNYEYCAAFLDGAQVTFELVYQLDDSRTVAVIIPDEPWLTDTLHSKIIFSNITTYRKEIRALQLLPTKPSQRVHTTSTGL